MALTRLRNGGGKVVTWVCRHREAEGVVVGPIALPGSCPF
jgi:hypothetical protein